MFKKNTFGQNLHVFSYIHRLGGEISQFPQFMPHEADMATANVVLCHYVHLLAHMCVVTQRNHQHFGHVESTLTNMFS